MIMPVDAVICGDGISLTESSFEGKLGVFEPGKKVLEGPDFPSYNLSTGLIPFPHCASLLNHTWQTRQERAVSVLYDSKSGHAYKLEMEAK
jgi:hypothetical protein